MNARDKYLSELAKYPSFDDFLMFQPGLVAFKTLMGNTILQSNISNEINAYGKPSSNGFIILLDYENDELDCSIIIKSTMDPGSDNLYYEYLAGQCINEFSKYFPFFIRTYALGKYQNQPSWTLFRETYKQLGKTNTLSEPLEKYIAFLDTSKYIENLNRSCSESLYFNIFSQFIDTSESLWYYINKFVDKSDNFKKKYEVHLSTIVTILFMLYGGLSNLSDYFSHYDLHFNNVLLYKIPDEKYIMVRADTPAGPVQFQTRFIPIIIDYGRSFFNCSALNLLAKSSVELMRDVCDRDSYGPVNDCPDYCGDDVGFTFMGKFGLNNSISDTDHEDYYINRAKKNASHDMRGLYDIKDQIKFGDVVNPEKKYTILLHELFKKLEYDHQYGTPEKLSGFPEKIRNVHDVFSQLCLAIMEPSYQNDMKLLMGKRKVYGSLYLDFANHKPFFFIKFA